MTQQQATAEIEQVRDAVRQLATHAFTLTDRIAADVTSVLAERPEPRRQDLALVEALVEPALTDAEHPVQGAGFVAAENLLQDARWWLEWFTRDLDGRFQRLVTHSEPQGIGFYDYEWLPWYVVPRETGQRHVTGPYVDYLCTEEYTLTFTTPVLVDGRFAGVAGADIAVRNAEKVVLPSLCAHEAGLAVVNDDGRILSSNSGRHMCGDLLPEPDQGAWTTWPIDGLPLSIVSLGG